ncbi:geranylgeranyl reductase family protein [Streptomyces sp. A1547]|nr:geranylgeranyl reductase family protein [Streptomyces sp. A1547]
MSPHRDQDSADVIVVGAGPAGCTTAFHLAQAGHDVLLLEKAVFPRDKICGDGLTPRAVKELLALGVDVDGDGWVRTRGLRVHGPGYMFEQPWLSVAPFPDFGLVRTRHDFDYLLARTATAAGARLLQGTKVTSPLMEARTGRVAGVVAQRGGVTHTYRAPLVVAADGASSRLAVALGLQQRKDRPMGVAVRRYYQAPHRNEDHLELWVGLQARDQRGRTYQPYGYGWVFPVGDGSFNVGAGTFHINRTSKNDHRMLFDDLIARLPAAWHFDDAHATSPVRGAPLPAGLNRHPQYIPGMLLIGDAAGVINPLSGEGIDYAMESGRLTAETITSARSRHTAALREEVLLSYPDALRQAYGRYFTVGRLMIQALSHPRIMKLFTTHIMSRSALQPALVKLLGNLPDPHSKDALDRVITALSRTAPSAAPRASPGSR